MGESPCRFDSCLVHHAVVAELAYAPVLGTGAFGHVGSNPIYRTKSTNARVDG